MDNNEPNEVPPMPRPYKIDDDPPPMLQPQTPEQPKQAEPPPFVYGRGTLFIIALNVLVFIGMCITNGFGSFMHPSGEARLMWGGNYGPLTMGGQWWRLLTCAFVHDGIMHIGMNMAIFSYVGSIVEKLYGTGRYLIIYLLSALGSSLASMYMQPEALSVGASGAVLGCLGAFIAFLKEHRTEANSEFFSNTLRSFITLAAIIVVAGFFHPGTDNWGHLGGLITGILVAFMLMPKKTEVATH